MDLCFVFLNIAPGRPSQLHKPVLNDLVTYPPMKIAVAQLMPIKGDLFTNIITHKALIYLSLANKADAIFFPELSITGYEPELAKELASDQEDRSFDGFQNISDQNKLTIDVGMPTRADTGINISMLIFQPGQTRQTYSKQLLHADELPFFVRGGQQLILTVDQTKIAPAICYESMQPSHSQEAMDLGAEIYVASVAKSKDGVDKALIHYPEIARKYSVPVLMANCMGDCDNFLSVGQSAAWTKQGKLAGQLDESEEGILIFDTETETATKYPLEL